MQTHWKTLVVGAGQAGLALGAQLVARGESVLLLDANNQVGDSWRKRWQSLRLFTPSQYDGLPGLKFPAPRGTFPSKDEMADYLEAYARHFQLPIRSNARVTALSRGERGFELRVGSEVLTSDNVVLATGTNPAPRVPELAAELVPSIHQIHSQAYVRPEDLPPGDVLVVGAGTSGVEIAVELAQSRRTYLSGTPTFHIPDPVFRYFGGLYWLLISHLLTVRTPMGRKARPNVLKGGAPLIRVSMDDVRRSGAVAVPRVVGTSEGRPRLADGRVVDVSAVVWATGYRPDFSWVRFPFTDESGWPAGERGVSSRMPGLFYLGVPFQFGLTSGLVGGVGRDAEYVAEQLCRRGAELSVGAPTPRPRHHHRGNEGGISAGA